MGETRMNAAVILWAAGVAASPLGKKLGVPIDRAGRVLVNPDLSLPNHPEVFVIGDLAALKDASGKLLPGVAPVAILEGRYVAKLIRRRSGCSSSAFCDRAEPALLVPPFHYYDKGSLATIGRCRRSRPVRQDSYLRIHRLAGMAVHPHSFPDWFPEPRAGLHPVGVVVFHLRARRPPHHRQHQSSRLERRALRDSRRQRTRRNLCRESQIRVRIFVVGSRPVKSIPISRILLGLVAALVLSSVSSAEVLKIVVNDTIQPITEEYIARAIDEAQRRNDQAVLIEINTPGGLVESTRQIIEKITTSQVPVIVYVAPSGSRAGSAGIFILEAADVAAMAPGTNAGAAHPVLLFGPTQVKPDDEMKQKIENDAAALMRSVVSRRGRNVEARRERRARIQILHRAGGAVAAPDRLHGLQPGRSFPPDGGQELQALQRPGGHAAISPASPS